MVSPSVSPENTYILPLGAKGGPVLGASMDSQILTALFEAVIQGAGIWAWARRSPPL